MSEPVSLFLETRALLRVDGADAATFLQGLISNDIEKLNEHQALYAALLTPQGKYLFDFLLYRQGDTILLDTEAARADALVMRLMMYRLRAKVTIEKAEDLNVALIFGDGASDIFDLEPIEGKMAQQSDLLAVVDPRHIDLGVRLIGTSEALQQAIEQVNIAEGRFEAYDRKRIVLAVPDGTRDLIEQKSILLESNFEAINGVDFNKGCFVGQELTARTKHRALVKKQLMPIRIQGATIEKGTRILADGKEVGEIRSQCGDFGLALMRLNRLEDSQIPEMEADSTRVELLDTSVPHDLGDPTERQ